MLATTLAVGPTRTGYQNEVSSIILGGALDKVAAAMSKVSSAGVTCLQVVGGTPRHTGTCKVWCDGSNGSFSSADGVTVLLVRASTHFRDERAVGQYPC